MEIVELYGIDAAATARGHVVVIDVLRAFTCAAYAFAGGAVSITLAGTMDEADAALREDAGALLMGQPPRGAVWTGRFGNSPADLVRADLRGRRLVQRTGNGTQGVVQA